MSDCECITATKVCSTCKTEKPRSAFSKKSRTKDGLNCQCKECCAKAFKEYYDANHAAQLERAARRRAENPISPEVDRRRSADYRARNRDAIAERRKARYAVDARLREQNVTRARQWYEQNKERQSACNKVRYAQNSDHIKQRVRAYEQANIERVKEWKRVTANKRRARLMEAGGQYSVDDIKRLMELQRCKCANCGISIKKKYHIDHRIPVAKGGSNHASNIELLCPSCNLRKSAKLPHEFAQENGRLL